MAKTGGKKKQSRKRQPDKFAAALEKLQQIREWAEQGATYKEIADKLGVTENTFSRWRKEAEKGNEKYLPLKDALEAGGGKADSQVEAALFKSATGYTAKVKKNFKIRKVTYDPDTGKKCGETEELVEAFDEVHVPANVSAQQFWLANRRPDRWKYKPEEKEGDDEGTGVVVLTPQEAEPTPPPELVEQMLREVEYGE